MKIEQKQFNCPVEATLSLIGGKYKPLILWHLKSQPLHYMELQRLIPKTTPKMLSGQLHELATPISNGGLTLTPPGYFSGSARGGISQYHFYWLPPKEGVPTFFRPLVCHSLPVLGCILESFPRLHSLLSPHSTLVPRNVCLPIWSDTPDVCQKASAYSSLLDMT